MRLAALLCLVVVITISPAAAAPIADDYIRGYAAAILEREFGVRAPSLDVRGGVVRLAEADLGTAGRAAVIAALSRIDGVQRVVILSEPGPRRAVPPAPPATSAVRDSAPRWPLPGLLPSGLLFTPLLADPRWPHFSVTYRVYVDERDLSEVFTAGLGESFPVYRWQWPESHFWEAGIQALGFSTLDAAAESKDLLTIDYTIGGFLGWRHGALSGLARVFHTSAHLGDELALRGVVQRINLSYEGVDAKVSGDLAGGFRIYGGGGYLFRRKPESLDPWSLQLGLEFRSAWRAWGVLRPVAAADLQGREENHWRPALSLRAGAQLDSFQVLGRSVQLLAEYYTGDSRDGQFFTREVEYFGAGIHFGF